MKPGLKPFLLSALLVAASSHQAVAGRTAAVLPAAVAASGEIPLKASQSMHAYRGALRVPMIVDGITNQGWIVGRWLDPQGNSHWFLMNPFLPAFSDIANHHSSPNVQVLTVSQTES